MNILGFNITKNKKNRSFYVHVCIISTKRGRKILCFNGKEIKNKEFTVELWLNNELFFNFCKNKLGV